MKRQLSYSQEDEGEKEMERESKRNKNGNLEQREIKSEEPSFTPTFLRSLPVSSYSSSEEEEKADIAWKQWRQQQIEENKQEEARLVPIYQHLFQNPPQSIVHRPDVLTFGDVEEKKKYEEALKDLPSDVLRLIYGYNSPKEYGTKRERCYRQLNSGDNVCLKNINDLENELYELNSRKDINGTDSIILNWDDAECAIYRLLTNLPTRMNAFVGFYPGGRLNAIALNFEVNITINKFNYDNDTIIINISYSSGGGKYICKITLKEKNEVSLKTQDIPVDYAIDLILEYGPKSEITFSIPVINGRIVAIYDQNAEINELWNKLKPDYQGKMFKTVGVNKV
jgi:hypothetical protein